MTKRRIKNKWYMPKGWRTPRGRYRELKELEKERHQLWVSRKIKGVRIECTWEFFSEDFGNAMEE